MSLTINIWLVTGAVLSAIAAALHVAIVFKGAAWYRFFGAGEQFARAAERGEHWQDLITLAIAAVLTLWAAYALAGADVIPRLPFTATALAVITAIYLLRGLAIVPAFFLAKEKGRQFAIWSSLICLVFGAVHLIGLVQRWPLLSTG